MARTRVRDLWAFAPWMLLACAEEGADTPGVWYAVRRGSEGGPVRRITAPESFEPRDVTATHVWGVRRDELDVGYVTGLRLLPGQLQEPP
ncbi:MAG: hypothetical protein F4Y24_00175 [Gemmatimonadetes bacterium]|nr:hypothetical protein [Gemmatimonadota bacterium]MYG21856.1 hypothetical protein [Gemmatimonadota bacterium]MYJ39580.1 hypothetical protein [Gemmatimonadota bacterium]